MSVLRVLNNTKGLIKCIGENPIIKLRKKCDIRSLQVSFNPKLATKAANVLNISVNIFKINNKCTITISDDVILEYLLLLWANVSQYSVHLSIVTISSFAITIDCYYLLAGVYLVLTQTFRKANLEPSWTSKMGLFCKNSGLNRLNFYSKRLHRVFLTEF